MMKPHANSNDVALRPARPLLTFHSLTELLSPAASREALLTLFQYVFLFLREAVPSQQERFGNALSKISTTRKTLRWGTALEAISSIIDDVKRFWRERKAQLETAKKLSMHNNTVRKVARKDVGTTTSVVPAATSHLIKHAAPVPTTSPFPLLLRAIATAGDLFYMSLEHVISLSELRLFPFLPKGQLSSEVLEVVDGVSELGDITCSVCTVLANAVEEKNERNYLKATTSSTVPQLDSPAKNVARRSGSGTGSISTTDDFVPGDEQHDRPPQVEAGIDGSTTDLDLPFESATSSGGEEADEEGWKRGGGRDKISNDDRDPPYSKYNYPDQHDFDFQLDRRLVAFHRQQQTATISKLIRRWEVFSHLLFLPVWAFWMTSALRPKTGPVVKAKLAGLLGILAQLCQFRIMRLKQIRAQVLSC
ncbi:unnamed protein product [Amoebophrya sp. A120]|nr:unnamed protein product [Amoebophrya sp. A120]|eukprot:GSA120T00003771001.1